MEGDPQTLFLSELQCVPPVVRQSLLSDKELVTEFGIKTEETLTVNSAIASFRGSALFEAVEKASTNIGSKIEIKENNGIDCAITVRLTGDVPAALLTYKGGLASISPLLLLSSSKQLRLSFFSHEARRVNLPPRLYLKWSEIINSRPLTHDEILSAVSDFITTPTSVSEIISEHLARGQISLLNLVPRSIDYYEQLVGKYSGQSSIVEYVAEVIPKHFEALEAWDAEAGVKLALLCGAHSLIAEAIINCDVPLKSIEKLLEWSLDADALSQTTLIEVVLQILSKEPSLGPSLKKLVERYCGLSGIKNKLGQYRALSLVFRTVYGELGKAGVFTDRPPFWKRLAAFAQTALILRAIFSCKTESSGLLGWMERIRSTEYIAQSYLDLRLEPRWIAEFALEDQLRNELCGRVLMAGTNNEGAIRNSGIYEVLFSESLENEAKKINFLMSKAAGPLEGNVFPVERIPDEVLKKVQADLGVPAPDALSFTMLSNCCFVFRIPNELAAAASAALRRAQHRIDTKGQQILLNNSLVGLALVAAATRNVILADEIFIVIRNYMHSFPDELDLDSAFRVGMIACASFHDILEWRDRVGRFISMLGFEDINKDEAASLYRLVVQLCEMLPELWSSCGPGLAAIEAAAAL